jgi:transcriptional regulator with XRE-family HTH domain
MAPERRRKPRSPAQAALGQAVEQVLAERGMSQSALARKAGLDVRRVNALVRGQANPTYDSLCLVCGALEIPPSELMRRVEALSAGAPGASGDAMTRRG